MFGLRVCAVYLQDSAEFCMDLPPGVHRPCNGVMLRLAQTGVLHHIFGRFIDLGRVLLVAGEQAHTGPLLRLAQQMVQAQPGRQLCFSVFLRELVI